MASPAACVGCATTGRHARKRWNPMQLTHNIALAPTPAQEAYFRRAAGCARFTWNYALAEWNRLHVAGERPDAMAIKREFNRTKYAQFPWMADIHRDA